MATTTMEGMVPKPIEIVGGLTMTVPNANEFLTDMIAQNAVKEGIAASHSTNDHVVLPSSVKLTVTANSRRLVASARRLAGSVNVTYVITVPSSAQATVAKLAQAVTAGQLAASIQRSVSLKKGAGFNVAVTSKAKPVVREAATDTATTTAHVAPTITILPTNGIANHHGTANTSSSFALKESLLLSMMSILLAVAVINQLDWM